MSGHQRPYRGKSDTWLTPPEIIGALGAFDLDPCCPIDMPWRTAAKMWSGNGLDGEWFGRVWLNPPYGPDTGKWLQRLAAHDWGTALIFARTETAMFFEHVWSKATALLFLRGRLHFYDASGKRAAFNAGAPSVLVAYGDADAYRFENCGLDGKIVWIKEPS
jgi:hypothetical protein